MVKEITLIIHYCRLISFQYNMNHYNQLQVNVKKEHEWFGSGYKIDFEFEGLLFQPL